MVTGKEDRDVSVSGLRPGTYGSTAHVRGVAFAGLVQK